MAARFIEVTAGGDRSCAGRFWVARFSVGDWGQKSELQPDGPAFLHQAGWNPRNILVFDMGTGQGAAFYPLGGDAATDVKKAGIDVGPLFVPLLAWLYDHELKDIGALPRLIRLPPARLPRRYQAVPA